MKHVEIQDIKLRPDGSIDTAHYMVIGRQKRADQARHIASQARPKRGLFRFLFWPANTENA